MTPRVSKPTCEIASSTVQVSPTDYKPHRKTCKYGDTIALYISLFFCQRSTNSGIIPLDRLPLRYRTNLPASHLHRLAGYHVSCGIPKKKSSMAWNLGLCLSGRDMARPVHVKQSRVPIGPEMGLWPGIGIHHPRTGLCRRQSCMAVTWRTIKQPGKTVLDHYQHGLICNAMWTAENCITEFDRIKRLGG